jgi:hypothetical protein
MVAAALLSEFEPLDVRLLCKVPATFGTKRFATSWVLEMTLLFSG